MDGRGGDKPDIARVWSVLRKVRVCMVVSLDDDRLRARPMSAIPAPEENRIFFFTDVRSHKKQEIDADERLCLSLEEPEEGLYLSISGNGRLSHDLDAMGARWNEEAEMWWPGGPTNPNARLLRVTPEIAEFWYRPYDLKTVAAELNRARKQGEEPDIGDNVKLSFKT
jgi:general stress protein 26